MRASQQTQNIFAPAVRLSAQWRRSSAWLGPAWAVLCGIIAAAQFHGSSSEFLAIFVALVIAEGLWASLWAALAETNWSVPLGRWRDWHEGAPVTPLPYTQPGSIAAGLAVTLGYYRDWFTRDLIPNYGSLLASSIIAPLVALVLSAVLGAPIVLLSIVAILLPQLALALCRCNGQPSAILRGIVEVTLPLLLGFVLFKPLSFEVVIAAFGFGLAYSGAVSRVWNWQLWNLGQALVLVLLILTRHSVGAFLVGVLWLPQFLLQATPSARAAQWWLMASMLVAALAI
ncbi:MAG TPA: hypothetical protein VGK81_06530 [Anaerolineae bacterium]